MNPKHHGFDLAVEGLTFTRKFDIMRESDYTICLKLLLEYQADAGADPAPRLRQNKKRPTPVFQAVRNEDMLRTMLLFVKDRDALSRPNALGKTPLVMVAEGANTESNERCARMLLATGIDPQAGQVNPLMAAIREKNYRVMRVLYEFGVEPEFGDGKSMSPV